MKNVDYTKLIQSYCYDLNYLADLLTKLVGSYKLLVSSAEEFNRIGLAKRGNVEDSIEKAEELGKVIDKIINTIDIQTNLYIGYVRTKNDFIYKNFPFVDIIQSEVDMHLRNPGGTSSTSSVK